MKLSLVVPCYNEAGNVQAFQDAVINAFSDCGYDYEIIFVDDGSKDATFHNLKKLYQKQQCPVKVVSFSRNFGKEAGIYAGLQHASGEYISLIDADLQQRPEIVRDMVKILDENEELDVVAAYQDRRGEGKVLSFFKKSFYSMINKLSYTACERHSGTTKWNFWKLFNYAIVGIIGFSTAPLRFSIYIGSFTTVSAILYLIWVIFEKLYLGIDVPGYATIIVLILLLGSIQLFCIGIIGEYVGRTFEQSKHRPVYIAKEYLTYENE